MKQQAVDLLKQIIAIPSYSRDEQVVADFLQNYMQEKGFMVNRIANNLWIEAFAVDSSKPTLLLNAHIDTVKPVNSWTKNPHTPIENENKLYGLGSNDDGGGLVSLFTAFSMLSKKEQPYNLIFAASAEEEVSGKNGMELLLTVLPKIDVAIVGEPTEMQMAVAEKGLMVLDCTTYGKAGHAARNDGENAIYKALKDIEWFRNYKFPKQSEELGSVNMNVTIISAGTQHNVIPDKCTFTVDVRSTDCYTNTEILAEIQKNVSSSVVARSTRLNPSHISKQHAIVQKGLQMGLKTFGSPTLSDQALLPFPSLKMGPGKSSRSHSADEFIKISEIENAISIYIELLDNLNL